MESKVQKSLIQTNIKSILLDNDVKVGDHCDITGSIGALCIETVISILN